MTPARAEIVRLLVGAGIAGPHQSHTREDNEAKAASLVAGDAEATLGIDGLQDVSAAEALEAAAKLTGAPEPAAAFIDPVATLAGVDAAAERLREAVARGGRVVLATGHPTGMLSLLMQVGLRLQEVGAHVLRPLDDEWLDLDGQRRSLCYLGGVAVLSDGGSLRHTHSPSAMRRMLEASPRPDLVVADHGFSGAAISAGIPTITTMDTNDLPLAAAWAAGRDVIVIPLDDNRRPDDYLPLVPLLVP